MQKTKFNDIDEFVMSVYGSDSYTIKNMFENDCTDLLKSQILEIAKDGTLQTAIKEIGNWYNIPNMQNFNG